MDEVVTFGKLIQYAGFLLSAYVAGYATCKGLDYFFKPKPITTTKTNCIVPVKHMGALAEHKEISKTFFNHNGKVIDVSCYYKGKNNICLLTKKQCYHYD